MTSKTIAMPQVQLGQNGPMIGVQGLGCMGMSEFYGETDEAESRATLERALELGVTMYDTADMYGVGANEEFLAPFIAAHRDQIVIATKFGYTRTPETPDDWSLDNRPEFIRAAVDRSLKRLGVDAIDLYYMHRRDGATPLEESVGAMADLVTAGKVKWLGLSAVSPEDLRIAHAIHPIAALQSEWSIFTRDIEKDVVATAAELGVTIVPYSPLGRGMLTGQAFAASLTGDDARQYFPRFSVDNRVANMRLVARIEETASAKGVTSAQLALAWLYAKSETLNVKAVPIPGTRKRTRLEENAAAVSITLTAEETQMLEPFAAAVQGVAV
ncbi:aldo/keto reductase [Agrobacterium rubi]|uniref:Aldo/keto reductase n=1 Tax=Agrobacterium rubi TaxID=28099 RepID=A0AAE7UQL7_9HYPH|nr:aldo/keto reductase [Agrobacterium rubi]NTE87776.1 aldo/keto reductase [Agrobacterium rubi]NTF05225.1 aldo/keto reductase [Agrobacterium rubi]NTF37870.1 aldo/keto reductase [Agrobacterium rubi]OCJ54126.1 aldo/keto reductase [Agrobacterium rubi]QTG01734.1 aldo/keto reductase [Agrobacterium rubi]